MLRPIRDQVIWLHGSYRFESRDQMYATIVAARRLLDGCARPPLSLHTSVLGNELAVVVRLPMFESPVQLHARRERTDDVDDPSREELFGLLARAARSSALEARVDVL